MSIFALTYIYGGPQEVLAEHRPAHRAYLRELNEQGHNLASGPLGDDAALIIFSADSQREVEEIVAKDPLVVHGAVTEHEIQPWNVTIGSVGGAPQGS